MDRRTVARRSAARALALAVALIGVVIALACLMACSKTAGTTTTDGSTQTAPRSASATSSASVTSVSMAGSITGTLHSYDDLAIAIPDGWYLDDSGQANDDELMIFHSATAGEVDDATPFIQLDVYGSRNPTKAEILSELEQTVIAWGGTQEDDVTLGEVTYKVAGFTTSGTTVLFLIGTDPEGHEVDIHLFGTTLDDPQTSAIIQSIQFTKTTTS